MSEIKQITCSVFVAFVRIIHATQTTTVQQKAHLFTTLVTDSLSCNNRWLLSNNLRLPPLFKTCLYYTKNPTSHFWIVGISIRYV